MPYTPPPEIVEAINAQGLWHGTSESLQGIPVEFNWDLRWSNSWLEALDGLYVTSNMERALHYGMQLEQHIPGVEGVVHQVELRPGVELALDEDVFGWSLFVSSWNPLTLGSYGPFLQALEQVGMQDWFYRERENEIGPERREMQELEREMREAGLEPELALSDPDFMWYKDLMEKWTLEWAEPALVGWYLMAQEDPIAASSTLPDLRILNTEFELL